MIRPKGLGRGLEALLEREGDQVAPPRESLATLNIDQLEPGRYQPRTRMDQGSLAELAQSIQRQGLIQPILVRSLDASPGHYEIIAGERRWRAAQMAGLSDVPVVIRDVPDQAALAIALIENIQREDLNPLEAARGLARLIEEFKLTHQEVAEAIGRSRTAVTNLLRLLGLPKKVQDLLLEGHLDMGHARALLAAEASEQVRLAEQIVSRGLSVREIENLVRSLSNPAPGTKRGGKPARADRDVQRLEEDLAGELGTTVEIKATGSGSGRLILHYVSLDHLDDLIARLRGSAAR